MDHYSDYDDESLWFRYEPNVFLSTLRYICPEYYFPDHKMTTYVCPVKLEMGVTLTHFEHNLPSEMFFMDLPKQPTTARLTKIHITLKGPIPKSEKIPKNLFLRAFGHKNGQQLEASDVKIFVYNNSEWNKCCSCKTPFITEEEYFKTGIRSTLPRRMPCPLEHIVCGCYQTHKNCYATRVLQCPKCKSVQFDSHPEIDMSTLTFMKEMPMILKRMERAEWKVKTPWVPCAVNETHQSSCYCADCDAEFCQICFINEHKKRGKTGHELTRLSEKPYDVPFCSGHPETQATFFCQNENCTNLEEYYGECCSFRHNHDSHRIAAIISTNEKILNNLRQALHEATHKILVKWSKVDTIEHDFKTNSKRRAKRLIRQQDIDELEIFCQAEKAILKRENDQLCNELTPVHNVWQDILVALDKKVKLYDVQDIEERAKRALQHATATYEGFSHNGEFQYPNVEPEYLADEGEEDENEEEV